MKGYLKSMVGRAKGQKNPRALVPDVAPLWASRGSNEVGQVHTPNSGMQEWPDAFDGNPVQLPQQPSKSAIVQEASHLPKAMPAQEVRPQVQSPNPIVSAPTTPLASSEGLTPTVETTETIHLQPQMPSNPLALADSILGPLMPPPVAQALSSVEPSPSVEKPAHKIEPQDVPNPMPQAKPHLGKGPRPLQTVKSESGLMPMQPPLGQKPVIKATALDPESPAPMQPLVSEEPKSRPVNPVAELRPVAQRPAQAAPQPLSPASQRQPSLQPLRMPAPAAQAEAQSKRPGLVIGKLTVEIVEPAKPLVVAQQQPAQRVQAASSKNHSTRSHSNLKFGLGQL